MRISFIGDVLHISGLINSVPAKLRPVARQLQLPESEEACIRLLRTAKRGILSVSGDDGYPYGVPMDFVYEDGKIIFHCAKSGHKLDAVRRSDKVSFCVLSEGVREENDWWYHFTSVILFGRIAEEEDPEEKKRLLRLLGMKYMPSAEIMEEDLRKNGPNACVLVLSIEHMSGKEVREK